MATVDRTVSSRQWPLSDEGHRAARRLAERLRHSENVYVVSSDEVKARETANAFSNQLIVDPRFREVERPWTDGDYESVARGWLRGERVEGWESHEAVRNRMGNAVEEALDRALDSRIFVISHGLAISEYVADVTDVDPVSFWSNLRFPDARAVDVDAGVVGSPDSTNH